MTKKLRMFQQVELLDHLSNYLGLNKDKKIKELKEEVNSLRLVIETNRANNSLANQISQGITKNLISISNTKNFSENFIHTLLEKDVNSFCEKDKTLIMYILILINKDPLYNDKEISMEITEASELKLFKKEYISFLLKRTIYFSIILDNPNGLRVYRNYNKIYNDIPSLSIHMINKSLKKRSVDNCKVLFIDNQTLVSTDDFNVLLKAVLQKYYLGLVEESFVQMNCNYCKQSFLKFKSSMSYQYKKEETLFNICGSPKCRQKMHRYGYKSTPYVAKES